jgi:hypothetical protein
VGREGKLIQNATPGFQPDLAIPAVRISMLPKTKFASMIATLMLSAAAFAQTDEIEVYDAAIVEQGKVELTIHGNYTPIGREAADFEGGVVPNHATNGAFEYAYGVADFWELGLYLPVYTITNSGDVQLDGAKLRSLWVLPNARQQQFFYGVNVELSDNSPRWEQSRWALEIRPIIGWHAGPWDLILNPILDSNFDGLGHAHFAPAERVAYNASNRWSFALEEYGDLGPLRRFNDWSEQSQTLFAVADLTVNMTNSLEFGLGHGFTADSDRLVLKLIWNHEF